MTLGLNIIHAKMTPKSFFVKYLHSGITSQQNFSGVMYRGRRRREAGAFRVLHQA